MAKNILNNLKFYSGLLFPVIQHTRYPEWLSWRKQLRHWEIRSIILNALLEKTLESPLDSKEIKPVNPKGNQPWIFIGRTDAGAEAPVLWPPDTKNQLIGKDPDAGKDWGQKKGLTDAETVR